MARPLRVEFPGACYHVINRGNFRRDLFDRGGGEAFERALDEAARRFGWIVYAYVIMRNHFHIALRITEPNLSEGMKWLQGTWSQRVNTFRRIIGRPFQGRYKALIVEDGEYLHQLCNYIHLNPVKARIVSAKAVLGYRLSSLPRLAKAASPDWLRGDAALDGQARLPDTRQGWQDYVVMLQAIVADPQEMKRLADARFTRGWCIGSDEFKRSMHQLAIERRLDLAVQTFAGLVGRDLQREKQLCWETKLQAIAAAAKIDLSKLPAAKSHASKAMLAAALKLTTSASNFWLAARLGMGKPNSAGKFAYRWLRRPPHSARINELLSRIPT